MLIGEEIGVCQEKKESQPFSIRMDKAVYERLNEYCEESGLSKTVAIECAISMYIDDYDGKKKIIAGKVGR